MGDSSKSNEPGAQNPGSKESTGHDDGTKDEKESNGDGGEGAGKQNPPDEKGSQDGKPDESTWDEATTKYIKDLRKEAAKNRTKASSLEERLSRIESGLKKVVGGEDDDDLSPEDRAEALEAYAGQQEFETEILKLAINHNIGKDGLDYFKFLVAQAVSGLDEDEELGEDDIAELVKKAKVAGGGSASTSVKQSDEGSGTPPPDKTAAVTLDQFCSMSMIQKSKLFDSNRALYDQLMQEARKAKRLV